MCICKYIEIGKIWNDSPQTRNREFLCGKELCEVELWLFILPTTLLFAFFTISMTFVMIRCSKLLHSVTLVMSWVLWVPLRLLRSNFTLQGGSSMWLTFLVWVKRGSGVKPRMLQGQTDGDRIGEIRAKHVSHLGLSSVSSALLKDPPLVGLETLGAGLSSGMDLGTSTLSFPLAPLKLKLCFFHHFQF